KVRHDHTESIGNNQRITVTTGQTVSVGTKKEGGHDQTITVANNRSITVRNDQTLKVTNDRMAGISHDDGLYVKNDRRVTVGGKQEHTTTGDHISLVKGTHSLEVKGDLARKVSGALGIKVEGDIVLESSSRISLKAGGSFISIHAGGVDIMGPKINLNSGGSAGTPVGVMRPGVLEVLADEDAGGGDNGDPGGDAGDNDEDEQNKYGLQFHFTDDDGIPYANTRYVAYSEDGTQWRGATDEKGYTEIFDTDTEQEIKVQLLISGDSYTSLGGHYGRE
ncbi:type VI secretion system tip protein VgrG, partial [Salmonella enterica]|nr:type VI secretion system tip protein VgrG [Salmonella enterica]